MATTAYQPIHEKTKLANYDKVTATSKRFCMLINTIKYS